jgi:hypothetical protein
MGLRIDMLPPLHVTGVWSASIPSWGRADELHALAPSSIPATPSSTLSWRVFIALGPLHKLRGNSLEMHLLLVIAPGLDESVHTVSPRVPENGSHSL